MGRLKSGGTGCLIVTLLATGGFVGCGLTLECVPYGGNLPPKPIHPRESWPDNVAPLPPPWPFIETFPITPPLSPQERWLDDAARGAREPAPPRPHRLRPLEPPRRLQAMARLYVSQAQLDSWVMEGSARVDGSTLSWEGESYTIEAAVRFLKTVGGGADPHDLLGRVKTLPQLTQLGGEHYMDSVLLGDTGYEVQQGFVGARSRASTPRAGHLG